MTSRRPMTRSFSGNGRTSSFSEEEGNSSNGRNMYLSNVRPENSYSRYSHYRPSRSTLCSVMAQLTEDIQPSFETTLKSKAVSENCNVKFTCVVSGYPAPELKWYKDDMEMDRYCGLPKYEIRRNGKTHTLHIYNCTLDDAAIYQVSASNSKGIVSCSGVLEVGTMNEFKIHQRFFEKLKQKAEKKKRDLDDQSKKGNKENLQKEKPRSSPEHPQRKRSVPPPEEKAVVKEPSAVKQPLAAAEPNGISSEVKEKTPLTQMDSGLEDAVSPSEENFAKKRIKMSNGVDAGVKSSSSSSSSKSHVMGNGGENCYDGGISLAQFLAETLHSQATEEKQNLSRVEKPKEMDTAVVSTNKEKEREQEKMQRKREEPEKTLPGEKGKDKKTEEELTTVREKEGERQLEVRTTPQSKHGSEVKHHSKGHKDHDHHNIQTSISSMLHTVKDFFFGKGKKDSHDRTENEETDFDHLRVSAQPPQPEMPPSFRLKTEMNPEACEPLAEEVVPMQMDEPKEPLETVDIKQQSVLLEPHHFKNEDSGLHTDASLIVHKLPPESVKESSEHSVTEADDAVEAMEVSVEPESSGAGEEVSLSGLQVLTKAEEEDTEAVSVIEAVPVRQREPDYLAVSSQSDKQVATDESSPRADKPILPQTQGPANAQCPPPSILTSVEDCRTTPHSIISPGVSTASSTADSRRSLGGAFTETLREEAISVDKTGKDSEPETEEGCSSTKLCEEEKVEVKSNKQQLSDINRSVATELSMFSQEDSIEPCESKATDQVPSTLAERDYANEEAKCTSLIQEMNGGFPPTAAPESLEQGDLKMQRESAPSVAEEITEVYKSSAIQSSNSGVRSRKERGESEDVVNSSVEKDLESNLCNSLKTQEQVILEGESNEAMNESLVEAAKGSPMIVEELDETKTLAVTQDTENNANVLEEHNNIGYISNSGSDVIGEHVRPSEVVPSIQISTVEDVTDNEPPVPELSTNEHFIIPKIEIMEPELKECTLPLSILALNKPEPTNLQEHDATHVPKIIIQDQSVTGSPSSSPTQKGMHNKNDPSPTEKVKEVTQLDDERETRELQKTPVSSEQLPQMDDASVPVMNVLCTDDMEDDAFVSHGSQGFETQRVPLFVVPPISVTCHESDPELRPSTHSEWTETETCGGRRRGTKHDNYVTMKPEKAQDLEEKSKNSIKDNTPVIQYEALVPKVDGNVPSLSKTTADDIVPEITKPKSPKETKTENSVSVEDLLKNRSSVERLSSKPPAHPSLSPGSLRKFLSKAPPDLDSEAATAVPANTVPDKADEDLSGGSTPTSSLSCESSPRMKRRDSLTLIRSATPEELASGARRKIFIPKTKEDVEAAVVGALDGQVKKENPYMSPSQARRVALLQAPTGQNTPPMERRSPLLSRRKATLEVPKVVEETSTEEPARNKREEKPAEKKIDPLKAPQVIRKIRGEPFPDASGHLKLWCQFFNVLSDSTIKWYRDEEEMLEVKRSGGDESQVALAIVLATNQDCGVYGCTISNEYGTDTTDFLLSEDILSEILLRDDLEVGEEIEMTPMLFTRGLADTGSWGDKYFGRIMTETMHVGEGCAHKASKVKVIYGLDPIFESGSTCVIKIRSPIAYGTKQESNLAERNLDITKQECKVQNMIREYCKIFAAEARVIENFGCSLEVIPRYLMYRPANSVPYATVEADLKGVFIKYCTIDSKGRLTAQTVTELEQKCSTFQHWIHQWTHGNLLVTHLEGVDSKITNVRVVTKSKGYQGLTENGSPEVFDQFLTHHQCNYYCGLLSLRTLKTMDSLQQPTKAKGSRSPLLNRKLGSNSPQLLRKGHSPQMSRKANCSPKVTRKVQETEDNKSGAKPKSTGTLDVLETR